MRIFLRALTRQLRAAAVSPVSVRLSSTEAASSLQISLFALHTRKQEYCCLQQKQQHHDQDEEKSLFNFADSSFWDKQYTQDPSPIDWYQNYNQLAPMIRKLIPTSSRVLMVGCGNAELSEDMVSDGYEEIINIDVSQVVIDAMQKKYNNIPQLRYMKMDVQDLSFFDDCTFNAVIDKGTLDALMCGHNGIFHIAKMLSEISRVLNHGGIFLLITHGNMQLRLPDLYKKEYNWTISLCHTSSGDKKGRGGLFQGLFGTGSIRL